MSRQAILAKVRAALHADPADSARREAIAARLANPVRHLIPERVNRPATELVKLFKSFLTTQGAVVIEVAKPAEIPGAIGRYLREARQPLCVRSGSDPYLADLPWETEPALVRHSGRAGPDDSAGLSRAVAGVAETGTLVLASGAHNRVTLAFVPDTHIVVVGTETIVGSYEEGCALAAAEWGHSLLPRTLNFISGPSRTGDIGGRIVMGAHGPRRVAVVVVANN